MNRFIYFLFLLLGVVSISFAEQVPPSVPIVPEKALAYVIPIEGPISDPQLYILRRAIKEGIEKGVKTIILKINTPGGALDTTLKMIEALQHFDGMTYTLVDNEAISAGAYISAATDRIYFVPGGIMGAAAIIQSTGEDIPETSRLKIESYLKEKVRSISTEHSYRADVIRAMMDENFVFKIDKTVIKPKGELLTLTADEAMKTYGRPPLALLATGIVDSVEALLDKEIGKGQYSIIDFQITWSEKLAKYLNAIASILLGAGLMLLFIEFKTPGFGFFGIGGIMLVLTVFLSNYVAGLAGHEEILFFFLGILLLGLELFIFPGVLFVGGLGILMIFGSIIWGMADVWPDEGFRITPEIFIGPAMDLLVGLVIAGVGIVIFIKYLPKSWFWDRLILSETIKGTASKLSLVGNKARWMDLPNAGARGVAVTALFPSGQVEIEGKRYEARVQMGSISYQAEIEVVGRKNFYLIVKKV